VFVDRVEATVARATRTFTRSKQAIAAANVDLKRHQQFLERHQRLIDRRLRTEALKRLFVGLFLIGPIACLALSHLIARFLPDMQELLSRGAFWLGLSAKRIQQRAVRHLSAWQQTDAGKYQANAVHKLPGLDGSWCTGKSSPSNISRASELGLLKVRIVVASLGVFVVGFLAVSATTYIKEPAEIFPSVVAHNGAPAYMAQVQEVKASPANAVSGFAVLSIAPVAERVRLPALSIQEIILITRPLDEGLEQEILEVTPPVRKPKIWRRTKLKRGSAKQKPQFSLWEQLPWRR
jgi:hypothetical protein